MSERSEGTGSNDLLEELQEEVLRLTLENKHLGELLDAKNSRVEVIEINTDLFAGFDPDEHELLTMDGYDDCIVGVVERFGQKPIVCYDKDKVLQRLESEGCDMDEAEEFFYFNQIGAWVGDSTPCFLSANDKPQSHPPRVCYWRCMLDIIRSVSLLKI